MHIMTNKTMIKLVNFKNYSSRQVTNLAYVHRTILHSNGRYYADDVMILFIDIPYTATPSSSCHVLYSTTQYNN